MPKEKDEIFALSKNNKKDQIKKAAVSEKENTMYDELHQDEFGITLTFDGWTNVKNKQLLGVMVIILSKSNSELLVPSFQESIQNQQEITNEKNNKTPNETKSETESRLEPEPEITENEDNIVNKNFNDEEAVDSNSLKKEFSQFLDI
ncbi:hypothetical protein C2G38_2229979 [Gigaspora rosea]|uniref:DUF659 domain-containing protein n=1 Tax=Gigaspora rosea TaxID=44941 RepID=A0A397U2Q2_9GLOM|nr:hypothetical protein C2G38_2229979 [Gigaspora rosea]